MLLLGIDLGTSSVKLSVVDALTGRCLASAQSPSTEAAIISEKPGWAEQEPESWWAYTMGAMQQLHASGAFDPNDIKAIGIAYQMHGLVVVNQQQESLRNSIIWCDSRAVEIGQQAMEAIGPEDCLSCLLNAPGNFTASKLAWVQKNEPEIYSRIDKMMLPGDFLSMKLTGEITTTSSALSEGILWDFKNESVSGKVMDHFQIDPSFIPVQEKVFAEHGHLSAAAANALHLPEGIPVTYKAGDQLNNALSLNVLEPGEVAATAGTSGVIYAVTDQLFRDQRSRVNSFAHVNHDSKNKRIGVLLCINGCGILNRWTRELLGAELSYAELNSEAVSVPAGSEGLLVLPFGNGAERMLENRIVGAQISGIDLNKHRRAHIVRAVQEGIAYAFRYGLDIMRENGLEPAVIRAGKANMFLSEVFVQTFVNATGVPVELYKTDGSVGAAIGAGIGAGIYVNAKNAFTNFQPLEKIHVTDAVIHEEGYARWKKLLENSMASQSR